MRIRLIHSKVNVIEIKSERIEKFASCIKVSSWWHGFLVLTWCKKIQQSGKNVAPLGHIILAFRYFDFERTWWRLFQKRVVRIKLYIYIFIQVSQYYS